MIVRDQAAETAEPTTRSGDGEASIRLREAQKSAVVSRRGALWRMGAAVAGVGVLSSLDQHRAEAATGGNFILGQSNDAGATTRLERTSATNPSPLMKVDATGQVNTTFVAAVGLNVVGAGGGTAISAQGYSASTTVATIGLAIRGAGSGTAHGVFGISGSGIGVSGSSSSGTGVRGYSDSQSGVAGGSGSGGSIPDDTGVYGFANGSAGRGVFGEAIGGHGVHGKATTGWAGYFVGKVYLSKYQEMQEISNPQAPTANKARLFVRDNGSGKTQLCVRFNTGGVQVIKTQP